MKSVFLAFHLLFVTSVLFGQQRLRQELSEPEPRPETGLKFLGLSSCASANCHGGGRVAEGIQFASYVHWWQNDGSHRNAYRVLHGKLSASIVKRMHLGEEKELKPAYEDQRCLACHSTGVEAETDLTELLGRKPLERSLELDSEGTFGYRFQLADGVQCEACHGPAEKWLAPHVTSEWNDRSSQSVWSSERKFVETGFTRLDRLTERVKVCGKCHVGGNGRDMNHDMIAAGHPRLDFEFATFHARLPVHWDRSRDMTRVTGIGAEEDAERMEARFEAQAWVAGQLGSARQALELLDYRARSGTSVWPEFAEYNCFECHHSLVSSSWRQRRGSSGLYGWNDWYYAMAPLAGTLADRSRTQEFEHGLATLKQKMSSPFPDRGQIAESVRETSGVLDGIERALNARFQRIATTTPITANEWNGLFREAAGLTRNVDQRGWDHAAQLYLALVALRREAPRTASPQISQQEFDDRLKQLRATLLFRVSEDDDRSILQSPEFWRARPGASNVELTESKDLRIWDRLREELIGNDKE